MRNRQGDPVLLTLPRQPGSEPPTDESGDTSVIDQLEFVETAFAPTVEQNLLVDLLRRSPGLVSSLTDQTEVKNSTHPLAAINSYKHRMHALRCEYATARLRIEDLQTQVSKLEKELRYVQAALEQMCASRGWKLVETCSRLRKKVWRWLWFQQGEPGA